MGFKINMEQQIKVYLTPCHSLRYKIFIDLQTPSQPIYN